MDRIYEKVADNSVTIRAAVAAAAARKELPLFSTCHGLEMSKCPVAARPTKE